jgi:hypothetical protein
LPGLDNLVLLMLLLLLTSDIDACEDNLCTNGAGFGQCEDISAAIGGRNNAEGRICTCHISSPQ